MIPSTNVYLYVKSFLVCFLCISTIVSAQNDTTFNIAVVWDQYLRYAQYDLLIYNGITYWKHWVNDRGGLFYNGSWHQVEIFYKDASSSNPNNTYPYVVAAYEEMMQEHPINLVVSPFSTDRTAAAISVSQQYGVINFVPASLVDVIFNSTTSYVFNNAVPPCEIPKTALELLVEKGIKTYTMIRRSDTASMLNGNNAVKYLTSKGVKSVSTLWLNITTTDTTQIAAGLRGLMTQALVDVVADAFIYSGQNSEFPMVAYFLNELIDDINVKAAVALCSLSRYEQTIEQLGDIGDYWLTTTRFDQDFNYGVSGQFGGTTTEFVNDFSDQFGHPPTTFDATTPALLMAYYAAVNKTGTIDADVIRAELKTMGEIETFAFPILFAQNGTNIRSPIYSLQLVDGMGRLATAKNLIYPAPFQSANTIRTTLAFAIVIPAGFVMILLIVVGALYMRRQRSQVVKALIKAEEGERRNYRIDYSSLVFGEPVGTGGFGVVFKGEYRGADVAIKKLKSKAMNKTQLDEIAKESSVMIGLRHPNILLFMGVCMEPELAIVTEFMPRGSLHDIIHNDRITLPLPLIRNMALDVLKGLHFIHSAGFIHRDLKSPNLLVDRSWNIKIADFGLSALKTDSCSDAQVSLLWTAPEVLMKRAGCYTEKSDVYSFGIVLWELVSRQTPFESLAAAAISPAVVNGERPLLDSKWDEHMSHIISICWAPNPVGRPTVREARVMIESMNPDPDFEPGSSANLMRFIEKVQPPAGHVTFVFTHVCDTAKLWDHDPQVMKHSLVLHNQLMRSLIHKHNGYEVKSSGDAFLIVFGDPTNAVNFCLSAQTALLNANWSDALLTHACAASKKGPSGKAIFCGLTVNMGIHSTLASLERVQSNNETNYYGPEVCYAALLASFATKGCIVMGVDMYTHIMGTPVRLGSFSISSMGARTVQGKDFSIYEMTPKVLEERVQKMEDCKLNITPEGAVEAKPDARNSGSFYEASTANLRFPTGGERWIVRYEDVQLSEKLGTGSFGEVSVGTYKSQKVVVKQMYKQKTSDVYLLEMRSEIAMLSSITHPNIVQFIGVNVQVPNLCVMTGYVENNLSTLLHGPSPLPWDIKKKMTMEIARGMYFLHNLGITHQNIKSSNILVDNMFTVKIADFGFPKLRAGNQTMTQVGTVSYSAPEVFEGLVYTSKADVYSFAILLWEFIFNQQPWAGMHSMKIVAEVTSGSRPVVSALPSGTPHGMVRTMLLSWNQHLHQRPSFQEIMDLLDQKYE